MTNHSDPKNVRFGVLPSYPKKMTSIKIYYPTQTRQNQFVSTGRIGVKIGAPIDASSKHRKAGDCLWAESLGEIGVYDLSPISEDM